MSIFIYGKIIENLASVREYIIPLCLFYMRKQEYIDINHTILKLSIFPIN